jgi:hypothetical protein
VRDLLPMPLDAHGITRDTRRERTPDALPSRGTRPPSTDGQPLTSKVVVESAGWDKVWKQFVYHS